MSWSPTQYLAFEDDRTRPVRDLVAAIPTTDVRTAFDIGCGPGNSTEVLAARYPGATVAGFDSSPEMIAAARKRLPGHTFDVADVTTWQPAAPCDVILSNAVLQWVPDHGTLFPRLVSHLNPGGSFAIQIPDNKSDPVQVAMLDVAETGPWAHLLGRSAGGRFSISDADGYYAMLRPHCRRVDIWRTTYSHVLPSVDAVVEWFKGSGLRPYLAKLEPAMQTDFLAAYRERITPQFTIMPDGAVLLPFPRLFVVATR